MLLLYEQTSLSDRPHLCTGYSMNKQSNAPLTANVRPISTVYRVGALVRATLIHTARECHT